MKRRDFFKTGARRAAGAVVDTLADSAEQRAASWIRPPFAKRELDFLLACTRCDDCVAACPHDVIFKLPAKLGIQVLGTPALDMANKGCHLCQDWPCVTACEPDALALPVAPDDDPDHEPDRDPDSNLGDDPDDAPSLPKLAVAWIDQESCLPYAGPECGACAHACPVPGALTWQGPKPSIDQNTCTGCALCREACITEPKSVKITTIGRVTK
ncbi:MAG: hypothetical protein HOK21_00370 [Rhodospirillaceae bacterium]|jgi:ferredoxin-type protein NapG|nr:hypothetical protein [Rhodospirillaceae bacterium]MBT6589007.1 hypothetical protein [Rhodospirillaceae bacterium]MBT6913746.1 hypothetical protein [Rhodospirillaceae bacterium]